MTFFTFVPFIAVIVIFILLARNSKKYNSNREAVRNGISNKMMLNQEFLEKGHNNYLGVLLIMPYLVVGAFSLYIFISQMNQDNTVITMLIIALFCLFLLIPITMFYSYKKQNDRIKSGNYYFIKDNLSDKTTRRSDDSTKYYLHFNQIPTRVKTTSSIYYDSEIGDEFYILVVGKRFKAYHTKYFELEDESKLQTYFPE